MSAGSDVLIVGAGPAGSFLAYLLARAGYTVTIIDKATFPRDKVCGGGLSHKSIELLPFDISPIVRRRVAGAFLTYQNRDTTVKDLGERGGAAVIRSEFDHFLLEKAISAGARFIGGTSFVSLKKTGDTVAVTTSRGVFGARYLVGADGVFSAVRKCVFGRDVVTYMPAVEALVTVTPDKADRIANRVVFDFGGMPRGYGWIFPKHDHLNVGVFSIYRTQSIKADLARFMARYDILDSPVDVRHLGFSIPVKNRRGAFERDRVLLLGDAAGFAESFYGEGIYFALESALVAAEAFAATFDRPHERAYTELVKTRIQPELTYSEASARLFFSHPTFGFNRMVRNAHVNDRFAELIAGGIGQKACFYKTLLTIPYWLFSRRLPAAGIRL
ncbi:MAG TPA: geranylgeranyl reductase family protein [Vicinamibacterales bacterium]|jgi:geranylgeranyl reductase family protein